MSSEWRMPTAPPEADRATDPRFRTWDGTLIVDGLRVWDHDLKSGTVVFDTALLTCEGFWDGWFPVHRDDGSTSTMDGQRLRIRHHTSYDPVPPAPQS